MGVSMKTMSSRRFPIALAGLLLLLSACAGVSAQDKQAATSAPKLSGAQIAATITGNTLSGSTLKNESWVEYYVNDGTIHGLWKGNEHYKGAWKVDGDKLCLDYDGTDYDGCYVVSMAQGATTVYLLNADGTLHEKPVSLATGNPRNL